MKILIKNGNCYIDDSWKRVNILIEDEKIIYVGNEEKEADEIFDASEFNVIPGLIDPHVHFELNCGAITSRDDFDAGSLSASYGGVTTIVDFLDPTRNAVKLERSFYDRLRLAKRCHIDYHFHACIKEPDGDLEEYVLKMKKLGMNTIKLFTTYSDTRRRTYDKDIINLLKLSKKYKFLVCCHIENDELVDLSDRYQCTDVSEARSTECETTETLKLAGFAKETGGYLYMVHCSSGRTIELLKEQYGDILGKHFFIESCPQYFLLNKSVLAGKDGCLFTFAPPLRSEEERELMIKNIDYVNTIGTDHCSFNKADKYNHPGLVGHPLGIGGIEYSFLLLHKLFGDKIINKMSKNVAFLEGFSQKGSILEGKDADLVFYKKVAPYKLGVPHGKADYSVYENTEVEERIIHTMLRGKFILKDTKPVENIGELLNCSEVDL